MHRTTSSGHDGSTRAVRCARHRPRRRSTPDDAKDRRAPVDSKQHDAHGGGQVGPDPDEAGQYLQGIATAEQPVTAIGGNDKASRSQPPSEATKLDRVRARRGARDPTAAVPGIDAGLPRFHRLTELSIGAPARESRSGATVERLSAATASRHRRNAAPAVRRSRRSTSVIGRWPNTCTPRASSSSTARSGTGAGVVPP